MHTILGHVTDQSDININAPYASRYSSLSSSRSISPLYASTLYPSQVKQYTSALLTKLLTKLPSTKVVYRRCKVCTRSLQIHTLDLIHNEQHVIHENAHHAQSQSHHRVITEEVNGANEAQRTKVHQTEQSHVVSFYICSSYFCVHLICKLDFIFLTYFCLTFPLLFP